MSSRQEQEQPRFVIFAPDPRVLDLISSVERTRRTETSGAIRYAGDLHDNHQKHRFGPNTSDRFTITTQRQSKLSSVVSQKLAGNDPTDGLRTIRSVHTHTQRTCLMGSPGRTMAGRRDKVRKIKSVTGGCLSGRVFPHKINRT